jgi:hypothetical protein
MGLTRGLQLIADWVRFVISAAAAGKADALGDALAVGRTWLAETTDPAGRLRVSVWAIAFTDPWRGSRQQLRTLVAKWNGRL